jgi:hypothetical protein
VVTGYISSDEQSSLFTSSSKTSSLAQGINSTLFLG